MEIIFFFQTDRQSHWLEEIGKSDWRAGVYLYRVLKEGAFHERYGKSSDVLLLTDGESLVSFCTFAEQDEVRDLTLTPWAGFVYTFPQYRGHRYVGLLLNKAYELAKQKGMQYLYISTGEVGLYEKYGFTFWREMIEENGGTTRVYRKLTE